MTVASEVLPALVVPAVGLSAFSFFRRLRSPVSQGHAEIWISIQKYRSVFQSLIQQIILEFPDEVAHVVIHVVPIVKTVSVHV